MVVNDENMTCNINETEALKWFADMLLFLVFLSTLHLANAISCEPGWNQYKGNCYIHIYNTNDRVVYADAERRCVSRGAHLTTIVDQAELVFIADMSRLSGWFTWYDVPIVGLYKAGNQWGYNLGSNQPTYTKWCKGEPNNYWGIENCAILVMDNVSHGGITKYSGPPCLHDAFCDGKYNGNSGGGYSRYICKKPLPEIVCTNPHTVKEGDTCVCEKGFIDITDTDVPERKKYKKSERCIPKDPCRDVKDLTVNFIVDSSESIGSTNWDHLVEFLRSGSDFLPNTTRVGFVKYSTDVTFAKFLKSPWSKKKFRSFVPSEFENGETNTAAALQEANKMFKKDKNKNQVAVLITDGLPFIDKYRDDKEKMLSLTKKAAKKMRSSGVTLIALGYGPILKDWAGDIKSWLEDPEEDYFEYDKMACDFRSEHMCILMRKICRRFVDY